tara:strand:+ start:309 stop:650 length:342 start_codon:yes stop_codon:yes gene_type:complete
VETVLNFKDISIFGIENVDECIKDNDLVNAYITWDAELIQYDGYCEVSIKIRKVQVNFEDGHEFHCADTDLMYVDFDNSKMGSQFYITDIIIDFDDKNSNDPYIQIHFDTEVE